MKNLILLLFTVLLVVSCSNKNNTATNSNKNISKENSVSFTQLENYFPKNTLNVTALTGYLITNQERLNELFGIGKTMTNVIVSPDFSKEVVLAVIAPVTNQSTKLSVSSISLDNNVLNVSLDAKIGEKLSYSLTPSTIVTIPMIDEVKSIQIKSSLGNYSINL